MVAPIPVSPEPARASLPLGRGIYLATREARVRYGPFPSRRVEAVDLHQDAHHTAHVLLAEGCPAPVPITAREPAFAEVDDPGGGGQAGQRGSFRQLERKRCG